MKQVEIYTDGACLGNPGPGGWSAILRYRSHLKEISGGDENTTNNRMEITAALQGLSLLIEPCEVTLYSDSRYLVDAVTKGWLTSWQKNGWRKKDRSEVLNQDLWQQLLPLLAQHKVQFVWVKGHAGHPENERCDFLATSEASKRKKMI